MTKLVGSWRAPGIDLHTLARRLLHAPRQQLLGELRSGDFATVAVAVEAGDVRSDARQGVCALVSGPFALRGDRGLLDAYTEDPSCSFLAHAQGTFAGVVFDAERKRVTLFCDALGLGQLYYSFEAGTLLFASEQKCLTNWPGLERSIQVRAAEELLRHGHLVGDTTWLEGVHLVKPGHAVSFDLVAQVSESRRYFDLLASPHPRYGSYAEAKRGVQQAFQDAFASALRDTRELRVWLGGDASSRMLLAAAEQGGAALRALTVADDDSDEARWAQKACAVRGTVQHTARPHEAGWLLARARFGYLAEGIDLGQLDVGALARHLTSGQLLHPGLGELALGTPAIRGFDDLRGKTLMRRARRAFGAQLSVLTAFTGVRAVFADVALWQAVLALDVAYLLHDRLRLELAEELFPDYFRAIPVSGLHVPAAEAPSALPGPGVIAAAPPVDHHAFLRGDTATERFLWELLSDRDALYPQYVDIKEAHAAYWAFFRGAPEAAPTSLLRYASLELWLRQLTKGEFLEPKLLPEPRRSARGETVPDISIIVPAYNVEAYLGECLNSLCNQDLENIEILLVDDGSTDGTSAVIERFAAVDARIRPMRTENSGVYHARNRALELARGRYIAFVDSDDYVHPAMFRCLLEAAEARRADVAFCDVIQFEPDGTERLRRNTLRFKAGVPLSLSTAPDMIADGFSTLWNRIYDRAFLVRHGLKFEERFRISADLLFLQQLLAKATTIVRVPRALYYYRFATPKSLTSYEVRNAKYLVHLEITIELVDFWVRAGLFERYTPQILLRALRNFLWNTHIDEAHLREVFEKFHTYLAKLRVGPVAVAKLPVFERRVFQLLRAGDFEAFSSFVRSYRAKMIAGKGGELTALEQWSLKLDKLRARVKRSVALRRDKEAGEGRYRLLWPAAKLGLTLDHDLAGSQPEAPSTAAAPEPPLAKLGAGLSALRKRVLFEAELEKVTRLAKPGAAHRVLHFSNAFSVPSETFTYDVITGLEATAELDNYVMCFDRQLARERPYPKTVVMRGATRADLEALSPNATSKIDLVLERLAPDLVHCHFGWVGIPLVLWLARTGRSLPVVITMHGTDVNMWPARHAWYADALKSIADKPWVSFTTHTHTYRAKLERLGVPAGQIEVIPNSFDPKFVADKRPRAPFVPGSHLRVISVARMDIWKGHEFLIRGFARFVREQYANASLTLIGYGLEEQKLRALASSLGLDDKVRFYGRAAHHEVPVLLRNHDVYVQPSIRHPETLQEEGQPIAVLEAIATGMPVVVTDTGGMAETVQVGDYAGHAFIVPDQDPRALAQALQAVVEREVTPESVEAYVQAISEKHAREGQLSRTREVYARAFASAGTPARKTSMKRRAR